MEDLYKVIKRKNDLILKSLPTDYSLSINILIKKLRSFGARSDKTEHVLNEFLIKAEDSANKNIKYSTFSFGHDFYEELSRELTPRASVREKFTVKEIIFLVCFFLVFIGLVVFEIIIKSPVAFDNVEDIKVNNNELVFTEIEYATEYEICFYNENHTLIKKMNVSDNKEASVNVVNLNSIDELNQKGTYYIKVKVLSNNIYTSSDYSKEVKYIKE